MGLYTAHILLLPDLICSCCAFAIITAQFNLLLSAVHLPGTANSLADAHSQYGYKQRPRIHSPEVPPTFLPDLICFYLLCICQAQLTAWPMLCPTITPLPPFSVPITHRPTPIPAPVIDLLHGALQNPTGLFNTILFSLHSRAVRFTALCPSYSLQPYPCSERTLCLFSGSSTHNYVLPELRYPIP